VRAASLNDREVLQALWREIDGLHTRIVPSFFGWTENRSESELRRALGDPTEMVLVAEAPGDGVRGLSHLLLYDTPAGEGRRPVRRVHLDSLVVQPEFRRLGCGRALVEASRGWARKKGAAQMVLTVWDGNPEAERFYASLGFSRLSQVLGAKL
jgi:GNAT superfamily N-acetyltransferase